MTLTSLAACNDHRSARQAQLLAASHTTPIQTAASAQVASSAPDSVDLSDVVSSQSASAKQGAQQQAHLAAVRQNMDALEDFGINVMRDFYASGKHQGVQFVARSWSGPEPYNGWTDATLEAVNDGEFAVVRACSPFMMCFRTGRVSLPGDTTLFLKVDFDGHDGASAPDDVLPSKCSFYVNGGTLTYPCRDILDGRVNSRIRSVLLKSLGKAAANRDGSR